MVASDLAAAHKQFKQAFDKGDAATCTRLLSSLKLLLAKAGALGVNESTVTANNEDLAIARDVLEHAVFLGIKQEDETIFERNYAQLKTLYAVTRYECCCYHHTITPSASLTPSKPLGPSPREMLLVGLNMMRLLVQNRIAEFHTELELIPPEARRGALLLACASAHIFSTGSAYGLSSFANPAGAVVDGGRLQQGMYLVEGAPQLNQ